MNDMNAEQNVAFPRLNDAEITALSRIATPVHLEDGEPLFQAGERRSVIIPAHRLHPRHALFEPTGTVARQPDGLKFCDESIRLLC